MFQLFWYHCAALYVHRDSKHPRLSQKNIHAGINKCLSSLSSDKKSFYQCNLPYQKALNESGYQHKLKFEQTATKRRKRQRNDILWYNPPFSKNISTNIGQRFLSLVDICFPKDHKLRRIFNRNTIKSSCSCMDNMKKMIVNHNKRLLKPHDNSTPGTNNKTCNCQRKDTCPLDGHCLQSSVIYRAKV